MLEELGVRRPWVSLSASIVRHVDRDLEERLRRRWLGRRTSMASLSTRASNESGVVHSFPDRLWVEPPDHLRLESSSGLSRLVTIQIGTRRLTIDGDAATNENHNPPIMSHPLFDVSSPRFPDLLIVGNGEVINGRRTVMLRGSGPSMQRISLENLPLVHGPPHAREADAVRIVLDAEHHVVLRIELEIDADRVPICELRDVVFDHRFPRIFSR